MSAPTISRRKLLAGGVLGALGAKGFAVEPHWLEVRLHRVAVVGLPSSLAGIRIAQISDLHLSKLGRLHASIAAALQEFQPQVVALTGDMIDKTDALPVLRSFVHTLRAPGRELFATLGNWEHWGAVALAPLAETYRAAGARLLGNESVQTSAGIELVATDDFCAGSDDLTTAVRSSRQPPSRRVLLTHAPGIFATASEPRFALSLAGHTHGGQVALAGFAPWTPPGSGTYVAGFYETPMGKAYVSRGIGTSILPVRFGSRPELPIFQLVPA